MVRAGSKTRWIRLKRFPLDRFDWRHTNAHRLDLVPLMRQTYDPYETNYRPRGYRVNGKVMPVDERFFNHWNHDPVRHEYRWRRH